MQRLKIVAINDGPCLAAGLNVGDILVSYADVDLTSSENLSSVMKSNFGKSNKLDYVRGTLSSVEIVAGPLGVFVGQVDVPWLEKMLKAKTIKLVTVNNIPGFNIERSIDVVTSECAFGMNLFKDILSSFSDVFGGRSSSIQNVLKDARNVCLNDIRTQALELGANAVIGLDLDYSEISGGGKSMLFLVASGTAVYASPRESNEC